MLPFFVIGIGNMPRFGSETAIKMPAGETPSIGFPTDPETVLVENDRTTLGVSRNGERLGSVRGGEPSSVEHSCARLQDRLHLRH